MRDEGVTKYECVFRKTVSPEPELVKHLVTVRNELFALGWIGVYPDGIGFGNVSIRLHASKDFYITGTQTGHKEKISAEDISLVTAYDIARNRVECEGLIAASSEAMTHAAVYELDAAIQAVIHIHNRPLWHAALDVLPTTDKAIAYGTPAMAAEMGRLYAQEDLRRGRVFIMAGHDEGVIAFGENLDAAFSYLRQAFKVTGETGMLRPGRTRPTG